MTAGTMTVATNGTMAEITTEPAGKVSSTLEAVRPSEPEPRHDAVFSAEAPVGDTATAQVPKTTMEHSKASDSHEVPADELLTAPADVSFLTSVGQLPIAAAAVEQATALYTWAKARNEYIRIGLERGEVITKDAAAAITSNTIVQSVATKLQPLDHAAGHKLEELKKSYPLMNKTPEAIFQATRDHLAQLPAVADYAQVAAQAEGLLRSQLQQNYDTAKTKTNDLVKAMQEQTTAVVEYSMGLNLDQATTDLKKTFEHAQEFVSSTLAGAHSKAKTTIESHVTAKQSTQMLAPLQQQLERLKAQLDGIAGSIKNGMPTQQQSVLQALTTKVDDVLKAWKPVKDHMLAYFVAQQPEMAASSP